MIRIIGAPTARRLWRALQNLSDHDGFELAGYVAYTAIVAIFPFLIFLTALAGFFGSAAAANTVIETMFSYMPSDVAQTLAPAVRGVLQNRQGGLLTLGIIGTIWAASSGIEALRTSLNRAYGEAERRSLWWRRLQSVLFVIGSAVAIIIISFLVIGGPLVVRSLNRLFDYLPFDRSLMREIIAYQGWVIALHYAVGATVLIGALLIIHRWLPQRTVRWRHLLPGVMLSTLLLLAGAGLFALYLALSGSYSVTYGSLGGVVLTLLFFYINAIIFTFGAEFNAVLRAGATSTATAGATTSHGSRATSGAAPDGARPLPTRPAE